LLKQNQRVLIPKNKLQQLPKYNPFYNLNNSLPFTKVFKTLP